MDKRGDKTLTLVVILIIGAALLILAGLFLWYQIQITTIGG